EKTVKEIVKKHSQFVVFPINLLTNKEEEKVLCLFFICFGYTYILVGEVLLLFFLRQKKKMFELLFVPKKARYHSIKSSEELTSLKEYVSKMKENQKHTYYITDESRANVEVSPFLEALKKIDLEVLFLVDPIDVSAVQPLREYDIKKLVCVTKEEEKKQEDEKVAYESLTKKMKEILGGNVEKVIVRYRMTYSPCSLVTVGYRWSANMERIMKAQALRDNSMTQYMQSKKTIEINPNYVIVSNLKEKFAADPFNKTIKDLAVIRNSIVDQWIRLGGTRETKKLSFFVFPIALFFNFYVKFNIFEKYFQISFSKQVFLIILIPVRKVQATVQEEARVKLDGTENITFLDNIYFKSSIKNINSFLDNLKMENILNILQCLASELDQMYMQLDEYFCNLFQIQSKINVYKHEKKISIEHKKRNLEEFKKVANYKDVRPITGKINMYVKRNLSQKVLTYNYQ
ncbi:hypothetical protein RFI_29430, partial [Reticulomyxa filosa]